MEIPAFQPFRLKDLREAKGLRVQAVANAAELSQGTITKAETGKAVPGSETLAKIARVLDAPMEYFFEVGRDPDPARSAALMSYQIFRASHDFTAQERERCAAAVSHDEAPRTVAAWSAFCEMVNLVLGPPSAQQGLELVKGKGRSRR